MLEGLAAIMTQGTIIWGCALLAMIFFLVKYNNLNKLEFARPLHGSGKKLLYYIPLILIAVSSLLFGITHMMNVLGEADLASTLLQIWFAFVYGIVMAYIFGKCIITEKTLVAVILINVKCYN